MRTIGTYTTRFAAEVARCPLADVGILSTVVGNDADRQGRSSGVRLLVPEACAEAALALLDARRVGSIPSI